MEILKLFPISAANFKQALILEFPNLVTDKNVNGGQPNLNANYGHATQYQAPLAMRFGLRALF